MATYIEAVIADLSSTIDCLGRDGGQISPSIYDTAQRLRLAPPPAGVEAGLEWLISQQHEDGGWCASTVPTARDIPTLAAILAIHTYRQDAEAQRAIRRGLAYLASHTSQWSRAHINNMPLGAELILPRLLNEAQQAGFVIDHSPYALLFGMREQKLDRLSRYPFAANSAPTYSWEALEQPFTPDVLDPLTGVGHSPSATAAWLRSAGDAPGLAELRAQAENYLARAEAATGTGIPGVVPVVYPITGFELSYGLYALLVAGLLNHRELQDVVQPKVAELHAVVEQYQGLSFGETFIPDVDSTAVAVATLRAAGIEVEDSLVYRFWRDDHFYTFIHEINSSIISNAHALHALVTCNTRSALTETYLVDCQESDGKWIADKWHTSWRFSTLESINALEQLGYKPQLRQAVTAYLRDQRADGSWRDDAGSGVLETSYALLALHKAHKLELLDGPGIQQLMRARQWLYSVSQNGARNEVPWLGKEVYSARRVDRLYHLSALLADQGRHKTRMEPLHQETRR